jgi:hypothetical protein
MGIFHWKTLPSTREPEVPCWGLKLQLLEFPMWNSQGQWPPKAETHSRMNRHLMTTSEGLEV